MNAQMREASRNRIRLAGVWIDVFIYDLRILILFSKLRNEDTVAKLVGAGLDTPKE